MCGIAASHRKNITERAVPLLGADVLDALVGALHRGVVDQDVEPAEFARGTFDQAAAIGLVRDVAPGQDRAATGLFDRVSSASSVSPR
jgi:hypothetical protein